MDDPPRPELFEGDLDRPGIEALFADLAACAEIWHIRARGARNVTTTPPSLEAARDQVLAGDVKSVQVLYRFQGETWCDTLMAAPAGVRVVRVRQDTPGAPPDADRSP